MKTHTTTSKQHPHRIEEYHRQAIFKVSCHPTHWRVLPIFGPGVIKSGIYVVMSMRCCLILVLW